jgi:hypothetical protein
MFTRRRRGRGTLGYGSRPWRSRAIAFGQVLPSVTGHPSEHNSRGLLGDSDKSLGSSGRNFLLFKIHLMTHLEEKEVLRLEMISSLEVMAGL